MPTIEQVVQRDICVGCGACQFATRGEINVRRNELGYYSADLSRARPHNLATASRVCPFSNESQNEDVIAAAVFPAVLKSDPRTGRYLSIAAARVRADDYLLGSSSGGLTSWILMQLLESGHIDGVIHVGQGGDGLFSYRISRSRQELTARRKSIYYSTSFNTALQSIHGDGQRYALVGVPCFIKSARLLCMEDRLLAEQLVYFIGLVCGHLKSAAFAELLAWQCGVSPAGLAAVDFRLKQPGQDAGRYHFGARAGLVNSEWITRPTSQLLGGNWGHGMFQLNACNYCDDIFAETADVVLGDAWLPEYRADWRGTNILLCRNALIQQLIDQGKTAGELFIQPLSVAQAANSQAGNFRHRHEGLALRLADDQNAGHWVPNKRVMPDHNVVGNRRRELIRRRRELSRASHGLFAEAREQGSLDLFIDRITPLVRQYEKYNAASLPRRLLGLAKRRIQLILS